MGLLMKNKLEIDVGCDSKIWTSFFSWNWGPLDSGGLDFVYPVCAIAVPVAWLCISGNEARQNREMETQTVV